MEATEMTDSSTGSEKRTGSSTSPVPPRYFNNSRVKTLALLKLIQGILSTVLGVFLIIAGFCIIKAYPLAGRLGGLSILTGALICALPLIEGLNAFKAVKGSYISATTVARIHGIYRILYAVGGSLASFILWVVSKGLHGIGYRIAVFGLRGENNVIVVSLLAIVLILVLCGYHWCYEASAMAIMHRVSYELYRKKHKECLKNEFPELAIIQIALCAILVVGSFIFVGFVILPNNLDMNIFTEIMAKKNADDATTSMLMSALRFAGFTGIIFSLFLLVKSIFVYLAYRSYRNNA